ncbi:MAG: acyl-CoA synthetase, partial [Desulfuromonadales bacterium]|nr:acyl-CoA synthetase [Desulfuromonadales bacterium]
MMVTTTPYDNVPVNLNGPNMHDYAATVRDFSFTIPEYFNFGFDVVDRRAADRTKLALVWASRSGEEIRKYTFYDLQCLSNRFANALREKGVVK